MRSIAFVASCLLVVAIPRAVVAEPQPQSQMPPTRSARLLASSPVSALLPKNVEEVETFQISSIDPQAAPEGALVSIKTTAPPKDYGSYDGAIIYVGKVAAQVVNRWDQELTFVVPRTVQLEEGVTQLVNVRVVIDGIATPQRVLEVIPPGVIENGETWRIRAVVVSNGKDSGSLEIAVDREIPVSLWGGVRVEINDKPAQLTAMAPRFLTAESSSSIAEGATIGLYIYDALSWYELPGPSVAEVVRSNLVSEAAPPDQALYRLSDRELLSYGLTFLLAGLLAWSLWTQRRSREKADALAAPTTTTSTTTAADAEPPRWIPPVPAVPKELLEACITGNCILFAGSGVAEQAGLPTHAESIADIAERLRALLLPKATRVDALISSARAGDQISLTLLTDLIAREVPTDQIRSAAADVFGREPETRSLRSLARIPFRGILTTNWDSTLEKAFGDLLAVTALEGERVASVLRHDQPFIVKLHGNIEDSQSFLFGRDAYERALYENETLTRSLTSLVLSNAILFVGASIASIEDFFASLRLRSPGSRRLFALVEDGPIIELESARMRDRYGLELLPYSADAKSYALEIFLKELSERAQSAETVATKEARALDKVVLTNIGPFDTLELSLSKHWNVFLGNNGCGKSSVLRAVALALCGSDASLREQGSRLLKNSKSSGSIELHVGPEVFRSELVRDGAKVLVKSPTLTPLEAKQWVVLGFSALRGISLSAPRGPGREGAPQPEVSDLLPLITGAVDSRMDNIKQWLINLSMRATGANDAAARARALRDDFFKLLSVLTPGVQCTFSRVDTATWQIWVRTSDGEVPIDLLSQGTSSVLGWVGTLLQRMHETHIGAPGDAAKTSALVLVDEIDAHMHPEWQQHIIPELRKLFPNLQVLATTHSPLVVAELQQQEVTIFQRDPETKVVSAKLAELDFDGMRADQILTSPLFGLQRSRSLKSRNEIERFAQLLGKKERSPEEEKELSTLRDTVERKVSPGTSAVERVFDAALSKMAKDMEGVQLPAAKGALTEPMRLELQQRLAALLPACEEDHKS